MNKENLVKLAKYIFTNVADDQFNMSRYRLDNYGFSTYFKSKEDCGTVGCALGWSPFVEGLEAIDSDYARLSRRLVFHKYSNRIFGVDEEDCQWSFLFNSGWSKIDNSREGFVSRVVCFLEDCKDLSINKKHPYKNIDPNKINNY